jgi:hypothetical protein
MLKTLLSSKIINNKWFPNNKKSLNKKSPNNRRSSNNRRLFLEYQKSWYHAVENNFPNNNSDNQKESNHYDNDINV